MFDIAQRLYLISLILMEFLQTILVAILTILYNMGYSYASDIMETILQTGGFALYVGISTMMTFDRFLVMHYNIRYPTKWSKKKTKIVILLIVLLSILLSIHVGLNLRNLHEFRRFAMWLWITLVVSFLIVVCFTYGYIFIMILMRKRNSTAALKSAGPPEGIQV